jgi:hypothetical protein
LYFPKTTSGAMSGRKVKNGSERRWEVHLSSKQKGDSVTRWAGS